MTTINDAKTSIWNYLSNMGLSPNDLKITSFDSEKHSDYWEIEGDFQSGFMGNLYKFSANYKPTTNRVSKMQVQEIQYKT